MYLVTGFITLQAYIMKPVQSSHKIVGLPNVIKYRLYDTIYPMIFRNPYHLSELKA